VTDALLPALLDPPTDRPALAFPDGALTYSELAARAGALAQQIAGLKRVAVRATPTLDTAVGIVAALLAGVPAVPIDPRSGPRELAHVVADAAPDAVLADADLPPPLAALPRIPIPRESARSTVRNTDLDMPPSAPALVIYTSGTTGPPKGAVLSRAALAANLDALADAWAWTADRTLILTAARADENPSSPAPSAVRSPAPRSAWSARTRETTWAPWRCADRACSAAISAGPTRRRRTAGSGRATSAAGRRPARSRSSAGRPRI
jgi:acyl-CoA synthetase (AMP-forming)/AMP-acid ligase II